MTTNGTHPDRPPDTAEPLSPYDITPFNDALALLKDNDRKTSSENRLFRFIGIPLFAIVAILALTNSSKPDHVYVKTITVTCYISRANDHLRLHQRVPNQPTKCDSTSTDVSDLLPLQKDAAAQDAVIRAQLPVVLRKAFSITTSAETTNDVHDLVVPYIDEHSQAMTWFMDYYKKNNVAKLATTQTNSVTVDPIQAPTAPGQYIVGYTVTASNGVDKTSTHFLAAAAIHFVQPTPENTAGMKIYTYAIDDTKAGQPTADVQQ